MKISNAPRSILKTRTGGFTLLEMVAVLFVVGLVSSIVIPRLPAVQASLDFALKRNSFEQAMNGLAYRAFKENQDFTLSGTYDANGQVEQAPADSAPDNGIPGRMRVLPLINTTRVLMPSVTPAQLAPLCRKVGGWKLRHRSNIARPDIAREERRIWKSADADTPTRSSRRFARSRLKGDKQTRRTVRHRSDAAAGFTLA